MSGRPNRIFRGAPVNRFSLLAACFLLGLPFSTAEAGSWHGKRDLEEINSRLKGQVVDYTHNHGADRRIWSEAIRPSAILS